jgi:hypothetical protein
VGGGAMPVPAELAHTATVHPPERPRRSVRRSSPVAPAAASAERRRGCGRRRRVVAHHRLTADAEQVISPSARAYQNGGLARCC